MRTLPAVASAATIAMAGLTGCSSAYAADLDVGDCLKMSGPPDRPQANKVDCGSPASNFKVVAGVETTDQCPSDVDSSYSMHSAFSDTGNTICMDVDWVVGGCMNIDPDGAADPVRVDCRDASMPHRQRATQIVHGVASVNQCGSGLGYAYDERKFTVCVEDVS